MTPEQTLPGPAETDRRSGMIDLFIGEAGLQRAERIAASLHRVVEEKGLAVQIGGNRHIRVEGWCALASMVGVAPQTAWVRESRNPSTGDLEGYDARVEVVRIGTGDTIGAAEAGCYLDETTRGKQRWSERHAVKSMAQTRATSKAIGQVLRFIPVLAGFSGTPAEEMAAPRPSSNREIRRASETARISMPELELLRERAQATAERLGVSMDAVRSHFRPILEDLGIATVGALTPDAHDWLMARLGALSREDLKPGGETRDSAVEVFD